MARKHNGRHPERGRSRYRDRLVRRGQSGAAVRMADIETLRRTQEARYARTRSWWPEPEPAAASADAAAAESAGAR
jgi:hypothetical protein